MKSDQLMNQETECSGIPDIKSMIQEMGKLTEEQRRPFFENDIVPQFKYVSPLERDQLIKDAYIHLKPLGITLATVRKLVKDEIKPLKEVKSAKVVGIARKYNRTDVGNAQRLIDTYGEVLKYCPKWKDWLVWDGQRWTVDETGLVNRFVHKIAFLMQREALEIKEYELKKDALGWAMRLEESKNIEGCLKQAKYLDGIPIEPGRLDKNPWLLNVQNGTVNLKTGELKPHTQQDLISKICPVRYDIETEAPLWEAFLDRIFAGDQKLISYVQKMVGYSLTGVHREKEFYLCWGAGDNGKSVFIETIKGILGDYSSTISPDKLTITREESGATPELARLIGVRFVSSQETEKGRALREGFIKSVTGGDTVTARHLYGSPFDFKPVFKLWFSTNFKPEIKSGGEAMWRRVRLIPFNVTIPLEEQDKELSEKLKEEWPGIMAWAVRGCLEWQKDSYIEMPEAMKDAVETYKQEMDTFEQFIESCCDIKPVAQVTNKALRTAYEKWCQGNGERPLRQNEFSARLIEKGLKNERTMNGYLWRGIGVVSE